MEKPGQIDIDKNPIRHESGIHTFYDDNLGDMQKTIPQYLSDTLNQVEAGHGTQHENSLYLNSSDSLESLMTLKLDGKRVMTVSGSGEFAHAFINAGATEIICFDVSPAAAFNTELRHAALCHLTMSEYTKLFGGWTKRRESRNQFNPIWDEKVYNKVENYLSEEAKMFFRLIFREPKLIGTDEYSFNGFSRMRYNKKTRNNRFVGDIVMTEANYIELQNKAKKVKFTQVISDVNTLDQLTQSYKPDLLYISNIGYRPQTTIGIANKHLTRGVPEVMCTISVNESEFNDTRLHHADDFYGFYYQDKKIQNGDKIVYALYDDKSRKEHKVKVEIVSTDRNADYGLTLSVKRR
ncbi:MAG: hypothetical protein HYV90_04195 [Candidatus Woesebacteria bacterium]|nr:MAG: hypothetical protein HYV90_04195 [Candidatus Woesebacteria bacterium]